MRERVWAAANVQLNSVTADTDTTVHTLFDNQMGGRKSYNPKNKGKKSYQHILSFIAETREYAAGALRTGDRPDGGEIAGYLESVAKGLPAIVKIVCARADSGFYCWQAVEAYEKMKWRFIVVAHETARLVDQLQTAKWTRSPLTHAGLPKRHFHFHAASQLPAKHIGPAVAAQLHRKRRLFGQTKSVAFIVVVTTTPRTRGPEVSRWN